MDAWLTKFAELLAASPLREFVVKQLRAGYGLPPIVQSIHILSVAIIMGSVMLMCLRVLNLGFHSQDRAQMSRRLMPWMWASLPVFIVTGAVLVLNRPVRYAHNPIFLTKMTLLIAAIAVAAAMHRLLSRRITTTLRSEIALKLCAIVSLSLWTTITLAGRWIAYSSYIVSPMKPLSSDSPLWLWLDAQPWSVAIAESWLFPLCESLHVLALAWVVGTILRVDLRLMGWADRSQSASRMLSETTPWTWTAFVIAVLTGFAMFVTQSTRYVVNTAFLIKMALLLLAGLNMALFHYAMVRRGQLRDGQPMPLAAKLSGALSLTLWIAITVAGRWIGHLV